MNMYDLYTSDFLHPSRLLNLSMLICQCIFQTQIEVVVGAPPQIYTFCMWRGCILTAVVIWFVPKLDLLCFFLCIRGSLFLCHGSCWLFHSVLYWICKGPLLWSEYFRQLDTANWCCVWASVHNAAFDSCASSTRPVPSNKKKDRQHQRLSSGY